MNVWGPGVFFRCCCFFVFFEGFTTKGRQYVLASPVAGTELSLFISSVLFALAQWDRGSSAPVSLADDIKRACKLLFVSWLI